MTMTDRDTSSPIDGPDHAQVIALPPLIYLGAVLLGLVLNRVWPLYTGRPDLVPLGVGLMVAGVGLVLWAHRHFERAGTPAFPRHPSQAIVPTGPYRYSRNPMYLGMTVAFLGLGLLLQTQWHFYLLLPLLWLMTWGVIQREEAYLERKFGEGYLAYKARVRRWI